MQEKRCLAGTAIESERERANRETRRPPIRVTGIADGGADRLLGWVQQTELPGRELVGARLTDVEMIKVRPEPESQGRRDRSEVAVSKAVGLTVLECASRQLSKYVRVRRVPVPSGRFGSTMGEARLASQSAPVDRLLSFRSRTTLSSVSGVVGTHRAGASSGVGPSFSTSGYRAAAARPSSKR